MWKSPPFVNDPTWPKKSFSEVEPSRVAEVSPSISDYGIIGDCRSAALVSRTGSIDWLCWPRFDSPSIFAALLDLERGGHWKLSPQAACETKRSYLAESNVIETRFRTPREQPF